MKRTIAVLGIAAAGLVVSACGSTGGERQVNAVSAEEIFERLKGLEGTWVQVAVESSEDEMVAEAGTPVTYRLTSGGSAVVETVFEGRPHEMVTVYYVDNGRLKLTHYCAMGNQPHMLADSLVGPDEVSFTCVGAGNTKSHDDPHMHWAQLRFAADGTLEAQWTMAKELQPGMVANLKLERADN